MGELKHEFPHRLVRTYDSKSIK